MDFQSPVNYICMYRFTGIYYKWSKAFLEAGKRQLNGDAIREASSSEVMLLRNENE
jgi:hypothetical protein